MIFLLLRYYFYHQIFILKIISLHYLVVFLLGDQMTIENLDSEDINNWIVGLEFDLIDLCIFILTCEIKFILGRLTCLVNNL